MPAQADINRTIPLHSLKFAGGPEWGFRNSPRKRKAKNPAISKPLNLAVQ
jgi:hypothetical protein